MSLLDDERREREAQQAVVVLPRFSAKVCTDFEPDYDGPTPLDGCLTCGKKWMAHPAECATCHQPCRYSVAYGVWMHFVTDAVTEGHRADPAPEERDA